MILDSNVLIALFQQEQPDLFERVADWQQSHKLFINHLIFAEVAPSFSETDALSGALHDLGIQVAQFSDSEAFRAGQAFADYRRRGTDRAAILPDFMIGAQAAVQGWPLVTRDRKGFASYFPEVELIDPYKADHD